MASCSTPSFRSFPSRSASLQLHHLNAAKLQLLVPMSSFSSKSPPPHLKFSPRRRSSNNNIHHDNPSILKIRASTSSNDPSSSASSSGTNLILFSSAAITVTLAVANRVLYKLALVPMKDYPFFLAQFTTFG